jgi:hypothetical protein
MNAFNIRRAEGYDSVTLAPEQLEKNFAAHDLDTVAANAHVNYSVIAARSPNENPAGALHLNALFN